MTAKPTANRSSEMRIQMGCLNIDGKIYPLFEGVNTIGRNKDATVIVRDPSVSQQHALIIIVNEDQHFVSDLGSFNGTIIEHNKLNPKLLYELPPETIVHFAKCKAVYKKVSNNSQSITNQSYGDSTAQNTQNLNESFYAAQTQALNDITTQRDDSAIVHHPDCTDLEDDYNFADIPSPPLDLINQQSRTDLLSITEKASLSIHEMPTQIYCSDVVSDDSKAADTSNVDYQIITTKVDVHELPTQIMCPEDEINECAGEPQSKALLQGSAYDMPTQINKKSGVYDEPTQPMIKDTDCYNLCDDTLDNTVLCENEANTDAEGKPVRDVSLDVIEASHLDDSGLDTTIQSLQGNESGTDIKPAILDDIKIASSPSSGTQSPLHVSQLHRRTRRPIADDSEENDLSSGSEIIKKPSKKSRPLPESQEPDDSNSKEIGIQKKKINVVDSDDSETDIEDLDDSVVPKATNIETKTSTENDNKVSKANSNEAHKTELKKMSSKENTSDSDTDIEEFNLQDEIAATVNTKTVATNLNKSDSKNPNVMKNEGIKEKDQILNNLTKLNESDCIPNTQMSEHGNDDDDDDFNFMPENNSTLLNKDVSEQTKERIFDVSQKLKELHNTTVLPQNLSEESFHLGLSESSENAKYPEEQVAHDRNEEDDDKTPDISDIDEPESDVFSKPTQKIAVGKNIDEKDNRDIFEIATQKLTEGRAAQKDESDAIFAKPNTSKWFENVKKQSESQNKHSEDLGDNLFMQPTQPISGDCFEGRDDLRQVHKSTVSAASNSKDIFVQPTQKYTVDNEDDIFMQPTQQVGPSDALVIGSMSLDHCKPPMMPDKNQLVDDAFIQPTQLLTDFPGKTQNKKPDDNDIFMQPTQELVSTDVLINKPSLSHHEPDVSDTNLPIDDVFMQPTQLLTVSRGKTQNKKPDDNDIFMQPTQELVSNDALINEPPLSHHEPDVSDKTLPIDDVFIQPTQLLTVSQGKTQNKKPDDNDIFMQPTQELVSNKALTSEPQLSHQEPEVSIKNQLEDFIFIQPTQVFPGTSTLAAKDLPNKNIFQEPTQKLEVPEFKADNRKLAKTDLLKMVIKQIPSTVSSNEAPPDKVMQPPPRPSLSLHKDSEKRDTFDEVESQLEVMFASQTLRMSSQTDSRPSNPLADVFNQEQTAGFEQNSEEPEAKKSDASDNKDDVRLTDSSSSCEGSKEYCAMSTLPIDEVIDFPVQNKSKNRRQPPKSTEGANVSDGTPRKRGRFTKVNIKESTSELNNRKTKKRDASDKGDEDVRLCDSGSGSEDLKEYCTMSTMPRDEVTDFPAQNKSKSRRQPPKTTEGANVSDGTPRKRGRFTKVNMKESTSEANNRTTKKSDASGKGDEDITLRDSDSSSDDLKEYCTMSTMPIDEVTDFQAQNKSKSRRQPPKTTEVANVSDGTPRKRGRPNVNTNESTSELNISNTKKSMRTRKGNSDNKIAIVNKPLLEQEECPDTSTTKNKTDIKPENIPCRTSLRRTNTKKQNIPTNIESVAKQGRTTLRSKKSEDTLETNAGDNSDKSESEEGNIATTSGAKRRKVNNKQNSESKIMPEESDALSSNKEELDNRSTITDKRKKQSLISKKVQNTDKTAKFETSHGESSKDPKFTAPDVTEAKKSKRLLSRNSENDKLNPPLKKIKNTESSENEEVKSNSDSSEVNLRTPRKSKANLNVTTNTPDRIRRVLKPKVVFTMLNSPELESTVRTLGGMVVDTVSACTVLVTGALKRSQKLLSAVGEGKPICSANWLQDSKKANKFLDPWDYILEDDEAHNKWNFTLKESLNRSQNTKLFQEFTVVLAVTEAVDVLKAAIESCGGKCVMKCPSKNLENNLIVVANPNKKTAYSRFLKHKPPVTVVAPEAIFDGVLRQELHLEDHKLS